MSKQNVFGYVEFIALVNNTGWITDSSIDIPDTEMDRQCASRSYYKEAIQGKPYVSKEYISTITNNYNITVSMPVYKNGVIDGIVFADINLND
jgi:methyl-accepting chemotaxis protein